MNDITKTAQIHYVAFDKKSGHILHTHSKVSAETGEYLDCDAEAIKAMVVQDQSIVESLTDKDVKNVDVLRVAGTTNPLIGLRGGLLVDVKEKRLVQLPWLELTTAKSELLGDGQDETKIEIEAVSAAERPVLRVAGKVKVTTTRGRLSARGGVVDMVQGRATINLTSVNETVARVTVTAESLTGICGKGSLELEFV